MVQILAVALKLVMRNCLNDHKQIAGNPSHGCAVAFASNAQLHAILNSPGNVNGDNRFFPHHSPFIGTRWSVLDRLASSLALRAR